ncbi:MAG: chromate transporter [Oscillospiraceae bacterium]|jgi:chromate transporter|nr:chromate transporter [Oscillospiraceae bacterium]
MREVLMLALIYARVGVTTFGGGYAMLPMLSRELVEKRAWLTEAEFADMIVVGQCTPGIIGLNMATYAGYKRAGVPGGIAATLGLVLPSAVIISLIAALLQGFAEYAVVRHAFAGVRVAVCALIIKTIASLWRSAVKAPEAGAVFAVVFLLAVFTKLHPVVLALASAAFGICFTKLRARAK